MSRYDDPDGGGWRGPPRSRLRAGGGRRYSTGMLAIGSVSIVVTLALVLGSLYAYVRYRTVWDSIHRIDVSQDLSKRPPKYGNALNILLIGSDTRSGRNGKIGGYTPGQRSDTVMVLHISPGRHTAVVLSFPRDSVVPVLQCAPIDGTSGQQAQPGQVEQLNSTFSFGGPGCLQTTLEQTTHIRLDDFIQLTFVGFEKIINDVGGVNVCLPQAVNVPQSGLHLSKGPHHVYGPQALAFWRSRESLGLGSDLQRIQRDQFLMASLLQGIKKSGILNSPRKMITVVTDAAQAMRTDTGLTPGKMLQIAQSLRGLATKSVQFIEVPTEAYSLNQNWVQWIVPQDPQLFAAIAHDSKLPKLPKSTKSKKSKTKLAKSGSTSGKSGTASAESGKSAVLGTISPSKVTVEVLNGSAAQGIAASTAAALTSRGFKVAGTGNAANSAYATSVVEYASAADRPAARTLKGQLGNVTMRRDSSLTPGTVDLILGSSFTALKPVSAVSAHAQVAGLTKQYGGITGNVKICKDSTAFAS
jgi:LCP family protein required for cell wall assembly